MTSAVRVFLVSISAAADRNGVVTFAKFFSNQRQRFVSEGFAMHFLFATGDLAERAVAKNQTLEGAAVRRSFVRQFLVDRLKSPISSSPLGAFAWAAVALLSRGASACTRELRAIHSESDAVLFYQDFITALIGIVLHPKGLKRILIHHSGSDPIETLLFLFSPMRGTLYERVIRRVVHYVEARMDALVTLSDGFASELRRAHPGKRVVTIYSSTALAPPATKRRRPIGESVLKLVAVGSLQFHKGFDLLIDAIALLPAAQQRRVKLSIVGSGDQYVSLARKVSDTRLEKHIALVGASDDVARYLEESDLFVLPSRNEGLPLALVEALAFGLPAIATRVGAVPEVLEGGGGILVEARADCLAGAISRLLDEPTQLAKLSSDAYSVFQRKLSPEGFVSAYTTLFRDVSILKTPS